MFQQRFRKFRDIVVSFGKASILVFPVRLASILDDYTNLFYTGRIIKGFKSCGSHFYVKRPLTVFHPENITIGNDVYIYNNAILATHLSNSKLEIGNSVLVGESCHISCANRVVVGDNVLLGRRVHITDNSHGNTSVESIITPPWIAP